MGIRRVIGWLCLSMLWCYTVGAQQPHKKLTQILNNHLAEYTNPLYTTKDKFVVKQIQTNDQAKVLTIHLSESFLGQPFTPEIIDRIYHDIKAVLPSPYNQWELMIYSKGFPLHSLLPITLMEDKRDPERFYASKRLYKGNPWVKRASEPYSIEKGLQNRHLCIWASHGRYYNGKKNRWEWQRPNLFCTNEDLFTQTLVVPYLIPMLENAGAIVYSPRERDWQANEIIVDNDRPNQNGIYTETNERHEWLDAGTGFAHLRAVYTGNENPFIEGTARVIEAQNSKRDLSVVTWQPLITKSGKYAVYVSYKTLPNSVSDATYVVRHKGVETLFKVNQQMGGGTWVYLGSFEFDANNPQDNHIALTNYSNYRGVVTADAVRIGGGMGNIARTHPKGKNQEWRVSGMPRYLEGSRYFAQWAGIPPYIYTPFENEDDYKDDIKGRPLLANYLAEGSVYLPGDSGLCVPLELSMGIHSDAGAYADHTHVGSMAIYTTEWNEGKTALGLSRLTSRDLADIVLNQIHNDLTQTFGQWTRRHLFDKNYGESREPLIPGIILETLSHQNYWDLYRGHDPYFKFTLARAIYKGILRYIAQVYNLEQIVTQPLPVTNMAAHIDPVNHRVELSWTPTFDLLDASAMPTGYVLYMRKGKGGYDNGTLIQGKTQISLNLEPGVMHYFRIAAINEGGKSMLSDEVCAMSVGNDAPRILVVDGFKRVAGPQPIESEQVQGFSIDIDPGVVDDHMPGYCGKQIDFDLSNLGTTLGHSNNDLEQVLLTGNTHDYASQHADDICSTIRCNIGSCSAEAIAQIPITQYQLCDVIMGAQKVDGYSCRQYKTFTPSLQGALKQFTLAGGNLLLSGAYIGSDMQSAEERAFTQDVFKYQFATTQANDSLMKIQGMNTHFELIKQLDGSSYFVPTSDVISPCHDAFSTMVYQPTGYSATVAYPGTHYHSIVFGFPLECIPDSQTRRQIFQAAIQFLMNR